MKQTILLANNNEAYLRLLKEALTNEGYSVILAKSLDEARVAVKNRRFNLAIFDLRLRKDTDDKDTSGLHLAKIVPSDIPKIILTRWPRYPIVRSALTVGANGQAAAINFIAKQENTPALLEAVRNAFETIKNNKLIRDLQQGNSRAWKRLWNEEAWRLINFARRYGLSDDDSREMCEDLFGELTLGKHPSAKDPDMRVFLFTEALNKMSKIKPSEKSLLLQEKTSVKADEARGGSRLAKILPLEIFHTDLVAPAVNKKVSQGKLVAKLKEAIDDLPHKEREAIVLYLFEERSIPHIARQLSVKVSTADKYLKNAHSHLRSKVAELE